MSLLIPCFRLITCTELTGNSKDDVNKRVRIFRDMCRVPSTEFPSNTTPMNNIWLEAHGLQSITNEPYRMVQTAREGVFKQFEPKFVENLPTEENMAARRCCFAKFTPTGDIEQPGVEGCFIQNLIVQQCDQFLKHHDDMAEQCCLCNSSHFVIHRQLYDIAIIASSIETVNNRHADAIKLSALDVVDALGPIVAENTLLKKTCIVICFVITALLAVFFASYTFIATH